jgi:tRNA (guanosine-2'-O-)-methyltransferase
VPLAARRPLGHAQPREEARVPTPERIERMRSVLARRQSDLHVVIENVRDPHNASAILRTADGLGFDRIDLLYTEHEFPDLSKKVSGHSRKWMIVRRLDDVSACIDALHAEGIRVYATHLDETARDFRAVDWTQPSAVIFGNEHTGSGPELIEAADERLHIPMVGFAQSFNVSVSAAIVLSEAHRQRLAAGMYEPTWDEEREARLQAWIARDEARRAVR